ncbi:Protein of unknown function [Ruminococcaceae bacterium YRB3002]|nr:Protein of unknown function [Ruminococcaceae bacterium YRB3002]
MGLNFRKSISLGKGLKLNISKGGPSISFGKSGLRQSVNLKGQTRTTVGIPGTGVYYTKTSNVKSIAGMLTGKKDGKKETSSKSTSAGSKRDQAAIEAKAAEKAQAKQAAEEAKARELEEAKATVAQYEELIDTIRSVHKASDGKIDWEKVKAGNVPADMTGLIAFADRILNGDTSAYLEVIGAFNPFEDLTDYGSNFLVGTDEPGILEVEFQVRSEDVVPTVGYSLTSTGKLSEKELGKAAYYDLVQDYVASTILRVARDSFALLPLHTVLIHACDTVINTATGHEEEMTLVSAKITRQQLEAINFEFVDPSDCLGTFECNCNFKKTSGYSPVDRILP